MNIFVKAASEGYLVSISKMPDNEFVDGFKLTLETELKVKCSSYISNEAIQDEKFLANEFEFMKKKMEFLLKNKLKST